MTRGTISAAAAALLCAGALGACLPAQELPEDGLSRLLAASGLADPAFGSRQYEPEGVSLAHLNGRVPLGPGYRLTAAEARGHRVEKTPQAGWQAASLTLSGLALATAGEPDEPRLTASTAVLDPVRTGAPGTAWRGLNAARVAFLDGDGKDNVQVGRLVTRWDPVGGDGEIRLLVAAEEVTPRASWLAGLGAGPCLVSALTESGPLTFRATLAYRPAGGQVRVESATLSGKGGSLGLSMVLEGVPGTLAGALPLAGLLLDPDTLPDAVQVKALALDYRDAGAVPACLAAVPGWEAEDVAKGTAALEGLPVLADERDRAGFAASLAAFAYDPRRLQLWLTPNEPLSLRYLHASLTSPARNRYLATTLAVNDAAPVSSAPDREPARTEAGSADAAAAALPVPDAATPSQAPAATEPPPATTPGATR